MRAIWSGTISFGLVNIPVKLYSATSKAKLDLDMLDPSDMERIRYKRVNEETGKEVPWEKIVKAYNLDDEYIVLEEEDFEKAAPEKTKTIDITEFTDESEVDPIYFRKPYYVEPEKSGKKAYQLFVKALENTQKAGIATFVLRNSESLALLRSENKMLILQQMRFASEIRDTEELKLPKKTKIKKEELEMAETLIGQYAVKFDASKYKEKYNRDLMKIIKAKASGKKPKVRKMKPPKTESTDMLKQLKASLGNKKKAG